MDESDDERPTDAMDVPETDEDTSVSGERLGPGAEVGGYIIDGELGKGGMGVVYGATHPVIGKRAAIKVLRPELSKDPSAVQRFINEARAVNQIGHPNIVDIFAFGTLLDGRSYYVMDLLAGETLRARLRRGAMHVSEAASVIDEIASALIAAHDKGIIHRDLKPDNVFLMTMQGRWPEVKLLDFGLAKLGRGGRIQTVTGSIMGTPVYMSPEQARASDQVDARTDIYSLGVIAYELLAGAVPFKKGTSIDTLIAHQDDPVPPLLQRAPGLPEELAQLVEAMLAKSPDDRPTLAAVRTVLKRLRGTKIPTMTAAGVQISTVTEPLGQPPEVSEVITRPRMRPVTPEPLAEGTPAPERVQTPTGVPITTLAGHSMPSAPARRPSIPPVSYPVGSIPPLSYPTAAGLLPPEPVEPPPAAPSRRWIVIAAVAAIASALGIAIALLA